MSTNNGEKDNDSIVDKEVEDSAEESSSDDEDFLSGFTPEQIAKIQARQQALQESYQSFQSDSKVAKVKDLASFFNISEQEAAAALKFFDNNELEAKQALVENSGLLDLLKETGSLEVKKRSRKSGKSNLNAVRPTAAIPDFIRVQISADKDSTVEKTEEEMKREAKMKLLIEENEKRKKLEKEKLKIKKGFKYDGSKRATNLRLSEALDQVGIEIKSDKEREEAAKAEASKEGVIVDNKIYYKKDLLAADWSEARIKSFMSINTNPNSYYYRFNKPGEAHRTGDWKKEEVEQFMKKLKDDNGVNYRWGEFSIEFRGRVGYQCSNFYRRLIQEKKVTDPNYVEVDGKLKFLGRDGKKFTRKKEEQERKAKAKIEREEKKRQREIEKQLGIHKKPKKKSRKKKKKTKIDEFGLEVTDESESEVEDLDKNGLELIPGLQCQMTFRTVRNPTLSPYGHIMGYNTWIQILNRTPRNTCPFTNQKLTRRSLIKLDHSNVAEHVEEIKKIKPDFSLDSIKSK
eukprot:maker-scaffold_1-snap-gene-18.43-mRNA-1 protein AED:0.00 eAED:0.00 QI:84/1/1/1/1/1/2/52/515